MTRWLKAVDRQLSIPLLLLAFWALFWALHGADEFFNGTTQPNPAVTSAVVYDAEGNFVHAVRPLQPIGWYGISHAPA